MTSRHLAIRRAKAPAIAAPRRRLKSLQAVRREEGAARELRAIALCDPLSDASTFSQLSLLSVTTGEFDAADRTILRMGTNRGSRVVEARVENIVTVFP